MNIYKTKWFGRFARKGGLDDAALFAAAQDVRAGDVDADLGGGVFKQRVARTGGGKSGGFRTIVLSRARGNIFFVYGFEKNAKANITEAELDGFRALAKVYAGLTAAQLEAAVETKELIEVIHDHDEG